MAARAYLGIPRDLIPWRPTINADQCVGCGKCLETCPNGVFVLNKDLKKAQVAVPDNCVVLCDKCAGFCLHNAITFPDKNEVKKHITRLLHDIREQRKVQR